MVCRYAKCNHAQANLSLHATILNLDGELESALLLGNKVLRLVAHDTSTPLLAGLLVLLDIALLDSRHELGQLSLVLGANLSEGDDSSGLDTG